jgi:hypothetical protein
LRFRSSGATIQRAAWQTRDVWEEIIMLNRRLSLVIGATALAAFVGPFSNTRLYAQADGWTMLFDGKSIENWNKTGDANWTLADGIVAADKGNGFLVTKGTYGDFQLLAEFWVDNKANSGVFIRMEDPAKPSPKTGYEVNIFDERPAPEYGTGAIVDVAKVVPMPKAGGKWNVMEITAKGPEFTVILNGQKTVDAAKDTKHAKGAIGLQYGAGVVKFRKVEIKQL